MGKWWKTAFKSLIGNGLKTWLNVFVLSISFVLIIAMQGLMKNWSEQAVIDTVKWEIADGQYWQSKYDPFDVYSLDSSTVKVPAELKADIDAHLIEPQLITQASIYPDGRMKGVLLRGIRPSQQLLNLPTKVLQQQDNELIPVVIGATLAKQNKLKLNDIITLRWRDKNGSFEAADIQIAGIFKTSVPTVDNGIIWISLDKLQKMTLNDGCANIMLKSPKIADKKMDGWDFKSVTKLTEATTKLVKSKAAGQSVFYIIFLLLAMLAIFDTQTLSIFRRQREIGTMVALGMTPGQVVAQFTLEGTLNSVLAFAVGAIWGTPLIWFLTTKGISIDMNASELGVAMADKLYASVTPQLVFGTMIFIIVVTAVVSYIPARKISKMNPTEAIRGKAL
jgi:ABC-type lipoprotein release transport system permease subunit